MAALVNGHLLVCRYTREDGSTETVHYHELTASDGIRWARVLLSNASLHRLALHVTLLDPLGNTIAEGEA